MITRILRSKFTTPFIIAVVLFLGYSAINVLPAMKAADKEAEGLKNKIDETNRAMAELDRSAAFIGSENYLERQARQKLNFKDPDENVVYIYKNQYNQEPAAKNPESVSVTASLSRQTSNIWQSWQKIWGWITR